MTLALAESMDPTTGVNMPIMANMYYYMFVLYFFITGAHLSYIQIFALSYQMIPIGFSIPPIMHSQSLVIAMFFQTVLTLAVKMAMPVIASQLIVQVCVGVIMKAVPNIQLLVINIQMKLLMGFFILLMIAGPMSDFVENLMDILFLNLFRVLNILAV
jgi:flagellar biosynthetic protein FliR